MTDDRPKTGTFIYMTGVNMNGLNMTKINHEKFLNLYVKGLNDREISEMLGTARTTITEYRKKYSLSPTTQNFKDSNIKDMVLSDKIYIASFIDGEGEIGVTVKNRLPLIKIGNTNKAIIEWLYNTTGIGHIIPPWNDPNKNHKPCWRWQINRMIDVLKLLNAIKPYLKIKHPQAETLIQICSLKLAQPHGKNKDWSIIDPLIENLVLLNKRGKLQ